MENKQDHQYMAFLRLPEVLKLIPVSRSTWFAGIKEGRYPKPIKGLGKRITVWRAEDIHALIQEVSSNE